MLFWLPQSSLSPEQVLDALFIQQSACWGVSRRTRDEQSFPMRFSQKARTRKNRQTLGAKYNCHDKFARSIADQFDCQGRVFPWIHPATPSVVVCCLYYRRFVCVLTSGSNEHVGFRVRFSRQVSTRAKHPNPKSKILHGTFPRKPPPS